MENRRQTQLVVTFLEYNLMGLIISVKYKPCSCRCTRRRWKVFAAKALSEIEWMVEVFVGWSGQQVYFDQLRDEDNKCGDNDFNRLKKDTSSKCLLDYNVASASRLKNMFEIAHVSSRYVVRFADTRNFDGVFAWKRCTCVGKPTPSPNRHHNTNKPSTKFANLAISPIMYIYKTLCAEGCIDRAKNYHTRHS